mgnify:FL=1
MEKQMLDKIICAACSKEHKTLEDYIAIAEKFGINLSVEDLMEIERVLKEEEAKCKESSLNHA